jgi:predicted phage terminase large subunit-like protein
MSQQNVLNAILRTNFLLFIQKVFNTVVPGTPYLDNWHIAAIAYHVECCLRGIIKRLIITLPPRSMKSIAASVALPAYALGQDPTRRIICASYAQDLANKLSLDTRTVMESPWYKACFPRTRLHPQKNTVSEFMTTQQGSRFSTSVGGTLTGRGGNLIIVDDPHKADEAASDSRRNGAIEWFRTALLSRLDNKQEGVIIVIQQRLHEGDLAGHSLEAGGWVHLNLPAIAEEDMTIPIDDGQFHERRVGDVLHPERESLETLNQLRETLGSYAFAAQYQQSPTPQGGGLIKRDWFKRYDRVPTKQVGDLIVQSWDPASSVGEQNDYSVCTTWLCHANCFYLLHVLRERLEYPQLRRSVVTLAARWSADLVIVEAANAGIQLVQELRQVVGINLLPHPPKGSKQDRMLSGTTYLECGRVILPTEAPWLAEFERELLRFPNSTYDDQADSLSQFLRWVQKRYDTADQLQWRITLC